MEHYFGILCQSGIVFIRHLLKLKSRLTCFDKNLCSLISVKSKFPAVRFLFVQHLILVIDEFV